MGVRRHIRRSGDKIPRVIGRGKRQQGKGPGGMDERDAQRSGVSLGRDADPLSSGVSLERETGGSPSAAPRLPAGQDMWAWLESIERGGAVKPADVSALRAIAEDESVSPEVRFLSNRLYARCALDRKEWLRCEFHGEVALNQAKGYGQQALCYELIFLARRGQAGGKVTLECMAYYDRFVEGAVKSALAGERIGIELLLGSTTQEMEDYALLAVGHRAWSAHPENQDDFDREEAEAAYHRCCKAFEEQARQGCKERIYQSYHGTRCTNKREAEQWRRSLLEVKHRSADTRSGAPRQDDGVSAAHPSALAGSMSPSAAKEPGEVEHFIARYGVTSIQGAGSQCMKDYTAMAQKVVAALRNGNTETMRDVVGHYQLFEGMQDYIILSSAALLWAIDPANTNVGERLQAQARGEEWTQKCMELMDPDERYPLYRKWRQMGDMPTDRLQAQWMELLQYVLQTIKQYNA